MVLATALGLVMLGGLGAQAARESLDRSLDERLVLAGGTAAHLENVLEQNLSYLANYGSGFLEASGVDLAPERESLRRLYFQTIFDEGVFLLDGAGRLVAAEPRRSSLIGDRPGLPVDIVRAMGDGLMAFSSGYLAGSGQNPVVSAVVPLRDRAGAVAGWVGGTIDLTGPALVSFIGPASLGETGYVEIVDLTGTVIASTRPERLFEDGDHGLVLGDLIERGDDAVRTCHSCHEAANGNHRETEVMAFAPLPSIPWGVGIRQRESEVMAPIRSLTLRFVLLGALLMVVNVTLAYGISRGIVRPIRTLMRSAHSLALGNLAHPVPSLRRDEVGQLGESLEAMRRRLREAQVRGERWSAELEDRVAERTKLLEEAQTDRERLLHRVISAQEDERKRVARELHDEVSQDLVTLAMALDRGEGATEGGLPELKRRAVQTLDGVRRIVLDLRPSMLDDLGLVAALRWFAHDRLERSGTRVHWELPDEEERLPPAVEVTLFRVAQEAISNIARHAEARNVIVALERSSGEMELRFEDDGVGFDDREVMGSDRKIPPLGIIGMRERVAALGGDLGIETHTGGGTVLSVTVPLASWEGDSCE